MGYTTDFYGNFSVSGNLTLELVKYITDFSLARHTEVDVEMFKKEYPDWAKYGFNGDIGKFGEFLVYGAHHDIYCFDPSKPNPFEVNSYNPKITDSFWCEWSFLDSDGEFLGDRSDKEISRLIKNDEICFGWNGAEKFYCYEEWLHFLLPNFLIPSGVVLNGATLAVGEDNGDARYIIINDNEVITVDAYDENAEKTLRKFCASDVVDDVYKSCEELSSFWEYDDY